MLDAAQENVEDDDDEDATLARGRRGGTWRDVLTDFDISRSQHKPAVASGVTETGPPPRRRRLHRRHDNARSGGRVAQCGLGVGRPRMATDVDYDGALHGALAAVASRDQAAALKRLENARRLALAPLHRVAGAADYRRRALEVGHL